MIKLVLGVVLALCPFANGLWCYETDDNGQVKARNGYKRSPLCVLSANGINYNKTTPFRTDSEIENVHLYKQILSQGRNDKGEPAAPGFPSYSVLTTCVIERYYISDTLIDYSLRCFCDHDYCNQKTDLTSFLKLTTENDLKKLLKRVKKKWP